MVKKQKKKGGTDFQKVKLKVGRRLPKNTNITDTSFKSKKIIIPNQLKEKHIIEPTSYRNLNIQELLSRLQLYNLKTKYSSISALKDLLTQHPELIISNLPCLLDKVAQLMVDKDRDVRRAACIVLNLIFGKISSCQIKPFFFTLSSYLCCAMTHIDDGIRDHSLKFLDVFLDNFPELTCLSQNAILQNFLEQISVFSEKSRDSDVHRRKLTVSVHHKLSSQEWRIQVLRRLKKFLKAIFSNFMEHKSKSESAEFPEIYWDHSKPLHVVVYHHGGLKPQSPPTFSLNSLNQPPGSFDIFRNKRQMQRFITILMPLLFDTWIESAPSALLSTCPGNILGEESAEVIDCILQVMILLGESLEQLADQKKDPSLLTWFSETFSDNFVLHFMRWFPYSIHRVIKKERKKIKCIDSEEIAISLNLAVCNVFVLMCSGTDEASTLLRKKVISYMDQVILTDLISGTLETSEFTKVVSRLMEKEDNVGVVQPLLLSALKIYDYWNPMRKDRGILLNFFCDLVLDPRYHHISESGILNSWLSGLALELVNAANNKDVLALLLMKFRNIITKGFPAFLEGLQKSSSHIADLLTISFDDNDKDYSSTQNKDPKRYLVELIYRIPHFSVELFRHLAEVIRYPSVSVHDISYLIDLLNIRYLENKNLGFASEHYLSFSFSILLGMFRQEGEEFYNDFMSNDSWKMLRSCLFSDLTTFTILSSDLQLWNRHMQISEGIIKTLLQCKDLENVDECFQSYLLQLFSSCTCLHAHSAIAILKLKRALASRVSPEKQDAECFQWLAELSVALLFHEVATPLFQDKVKKSYSVLPVVIEFIDSLNCASLVFEIMSNWVNEVTSIEQAHYIGYMLLLLLKSGLCVDEEINSVVSILEELEMQVGEGLEEEEWWSNINYEVKMRHKQFSSMN